jgi:hypothetical protein
MCQQERLCNGWTLMEFWYQPHNHGSSAQSNKILINHLHTFCSPGKVKNPFWEGNYHKTLHNDKSLWFESSSQLPKRVLLCVCVCVCACRGGANWGQWAKYWAPAQGLTAASLAYIEWHMKTNNMNWLAGGSILGFQVDPSCGLLLLC